MIVTTCQSLYEPHRKAIHQTDVKYYYTSVSLLLMLDDSHLLLIKLLKMRQKERELFLSLTQAMHEEQNNQNI